jgi:mannose-1-phosphate guanylyltransferase
MDICGGARPSPHHQDVFSVIEFKEKPDRVTAEEYLASGEYWWNSGMFVWRARTFLDQLEALQPKTHAAVLN